MKHLHIMGICGTFMGGLARLARGAGYSVSGSDANTYPPMSTQLKELDVKLFDGYDRSNVPDDAETVIVGNAISRGNPELEEVLDRGIPYTSGAQWLSETILQDRWVLAVAGTHGKTTTASILAWILEDCGLDPGFLIGGVPENFGVSARLGSSRYFVIEADEYDTAFFDKRSKFIHYRPTTLILNNLEFDHADIFDSIEDIKKQFSHLLRVVPARGRILSKQDSDELTDVLDRGCWSETEYFLAQEAGEDKIQPGGDNSRHWLARPSTSDCSSFDVFNTVDDPTVCSASVANWGLIGRHNMENALAAIAAAHHVGIEVVDACAALETFASVKRRLELLGTVEGISIYDDFAHHPTAITETIKALRSRVGSDRILAVLEPRSNTMKQGIHKDYLKTSLASADHVYFFCPEEMQWDASELKDDRVSLYRSTADIIRDLTSDSATGDSILIMSNGGFENLHQRLLSALSDR